MAKKIKHTYRVKYHIDFKSESGIVESHYSETKSFAETPEGAKERVLYRFERMGNGNKPFDFRSDWAGPLYHDEIVFDEVEIINDLQYKIP